MEIDKVKDKRHKIYKELEINNTNKLNRNKPKIQIPSPIMQYLSLESGVYKAIIEGVDLVNKEIRYKETKFRADVIEIDFLLDGHIRITQDFRYRLKETDLLYKLLKAIRGTIDFEVEDLEAEILGKEVGLLIERIWMGEYSYVNITEIYNTTELKEMLDKIEARKIKSIEVEQKQFMDSSIETIEDILS